MRVCMHVNAYTYTDAHTYKYIHMHMHTYTHICTHMYICMYMHTYTQTEHNDFQSDGFDNNQTMIST